MLSGEFVGSAQQCFVGAGCVSCVCTWGVSVGLCVQGWVCMCECVSDTRVGSLQWAHLLHACARHRHAGVVVCTSLCGHDRWCDPARSPWRPGPRASLQQAPLLRWHLPQRGSLAQLVTVQLSASLASLELVGVLRLNHSLCVPCTLSGSNQSLPCPSSAWRPFPLFC